ncbi:hypothetical protein BDW59DRAFT_144195 [Aspergillus cavernicola]|uniref:DUF4139 domain-containing protein n=1 Tax=Aspergillus cavernicola TaxID=176166 RepID=A0ABR4IHZ6_9EURO
MASIAESELLISELPTTEITLSPNQVTVIREIHTAIQPGQNEITILGLDPNVDTNSIRIEGSGPATITDLQTDIIPRREHFNDVYHFEHNESESEPNDNDEDEVSEDEDEEGLHDPKLQTLRHEIDLIEEKLSRARSDIISSRSVLNFLDDYGKGLQNEENKDVTKLSEFLDIYRSRHDAEAERNHKATVEVQVQGKELARAQREVERRKKRYLKEQRVVFKAARARKEKRARAREQERRERSRKYGELYQFWTQRVGQVVVSLDSQGIDKSVALTPGSSRRGSVVGEKEVVEPATTTTSQGAAIEVMLRLSYIIPGQSWTCRYELAINSPMSSARMTYRAEFKNSSSETWRDTRVTLSSSQASFSGLGVRIPSLDTWNIKLVTAASKASPSWDRILDMPRASLGPMPPAWKPTGLFGQPAPQVPAARQGSLFGRPVERSQGLFGEAQQGQASNSIPSPYGASPFGLFGGGGGGGGFGGFGNQERSRSMGLFGARAQEQTQSVKDSESDATSSTVEMPVVGSGFGSHVNQEQQPGGVFGNGSGSTMKQEQAQPGGLFGSGFGRSMNQQQPQSAGLFGSQVQTQPVQHSNQLFGRGVPSAEHSHTQPPQSTAPTRSMFAIGAPEITHTEEASKTISTTVELEGNDDNTDTQTLTTEPLDHQDSVKQNYGMTTTYKLPGCRTLAPSFVSRRHVLAEIDLESVALTYVIVPKHREAAFLRARIRNTSSLTLQPGPVGITVDGSFVGTAKLETCGANVFFNISLGIDPGIEVKYAKPVVKSTTGAMFFSKEDGARFRRECWVKNTKGSAVDVLVSDQVPVSEDEKLRVRVLQPPGLDWEGDKAGIKIEDSKGDGTVALQKNGEVKWTLRLEANQEIRLVLEYETKVPSGSDVSPV